MTTNFGRYQIKHELSHSAFARIFVASAQSPPNTVASGTDYVVKLFDFPETGQSDHSSKGAKIFVERALIQQKIAAAGSVYWAAVHESGADDGKPYYITDFYPRSMHKLIVGRAALSSAALSEVMGGIVGGLQELKTQCGRAHGNLKATNVLIRGGGRTNGARIALTDPSSEPCIGAASEAEDRLAVGNLLYQLVMGRPPHQTKWPIEPSNEWSRLGRHGERWRNLSNDLLNPNPANRPDYPDVAARLAVMVPVKIPWIKILTPVAALVIAAISIHLAQVFATREAMAPYQKWAGSLLSDNILIKQLEAATPGQPIVLPTERQGILAFCEANHPWLSISDLLAAWHASSGEQKIHDRLITAHHNAQKQEEDLSDLYQKRHWAQPAQFWRQRSLVPMAPDLELGRALIGRIALLRQLAMPAALGNQWTSLENALHGVESFDDADLNLFAQTLRSSAAGAIQLSDKGWTVVPGGLQQELAGQISLAEEIAKKLKDNKEKTDIWPVDFDRAGMASREKIDFQKPAVGDIELWLAKIDQYAFAKRSELLARDNRIEEGRKELGEIDNEISRDSSEWFQKISAPKPAFEQEKAAIRTAGDRVAQARYLRAELPDKPVAEAEAVLVKIRALRPKYQTQGRPAALAFAREQRKITTLQPPGAAWSMAPIGRIWHEQIERAWLDQRETLLIAIENNPETLSRISGQILDLPKSFLPVAQPLRELDSALAINPSAEAPAGEFERTLKISSQKYVDAVFKEMPPFAVNNTEAIKKYCAEQSTNYKAWCEQVGRLRDALVHVQSALDRAYLPDEIPPGYGKSVRKWLEDGRKSLNAKAAGLTRFVEDAEARLKRLDNLAAADSKALVQAAVAQSDAATVLAAWRQLCRLTVKWPPSLENLAAEIGLQERVSKDIVPIRPDVKNELQTERQKRWDNHLRLLGQAQAHGLEETVAWASANLPRLPLPSSAMPAWFQFDLLLYRYKSDKNLQASENKFREDAKPFQTAAAVKSFFDKLEDKTPVEHVNPEDGVIKLVKRPISNSVVSFNGDNGKIDITFIRVADKDNRFPPFFMSTTEVPIGLFGEVISLGLPRLRFANHVLTLLPANAEQPQAWVGPHGWQINQQSKIIETRSDVWCYDFHFKNGQRPVPNPAHPMQCVTPQAAMYMARLIGCRLPSADEWQAAYAYSREQAKTDPHNYGWIMQAWKLRDDFWAAECLDAAQQGANRWLDDGIFMGPGGQAPVIKTHASSLTWNDPISAKRLKVLGASTVSNTLPANPRLNKLLENNSVLFRAVNYNFNDSFHDLVGNVAEFVLDNDSARRCETDVPLDDADKVEAFFDPKGATRVYVIGGSALSPPELDFDKPWPVPPGMIKNGFTDVGFRLAFSDSVTRLPRHIDFAQAQYLTSDGPRAQ